ncbi:MAG: biopolymer transporter ExbD [Deltaproteobacteria bacterium]|jgi:biopolymer transport protein ExbD|nr:biopolymer transporter ExbD [Deltaproteobacteria bacterium]
MNLDSPLADPWSDDDTLDMTSLIDVVFLLLAFFILAASFAVPAMDLRLATAKNAESAKIDDRSLTISVDSDGQIYHGHQIIEVAELKTIILSHPIESPIYFNVDRDAPFGAFLTILDEAKGLNRERFMINAQTKVDRPTQTTSELQTNQSGPNPAATDNPEALRPALTTTEALRPTLTSPEAQMSASQSQGQNVGP